ncbi:O-acyltransferase [Aphelenchoides bicaudatus]|nr:O-acyltransferase [Aphelenchoides bicaudatus]
MSQSNVRKRRTSQNSSSASPPPPPATNSSKSRLNKSDKPDHPIHEAQDSLFSSSSGWTNYRGFFNLAILLLVVSNGRVALENLIKYGVLISPSEWFNWAPVDSNKWPMVTLVVWSNVSVLLALFAEKLLANGIVGNRFAAGFYVTLIIAHFTIPAIKVLNYDGNPLFSVWGLTIVVIEGLKLVSYGHVNYWCRCARETNKNEKQTTPISYPNNLTIFNMYYYIRKRFIFKRVIELITFSFLIVALSQQWVIPLALNLMAEILRFADREFYLDFWNSETITYFWRSWNIPVHRWAVRHLYKPIVNSGHSKLTASIVVFFVSAFFHEYLVSVPCTFTDKLLRGGRSGNIVVWLSLILGQPMAILMYVHDWYWLNHPEHEQVMINATIPHI